MAAVHRGLRERRNRIAIWTAVIEGILVIIGPSWWRYLVYLLAAGAVAFFFYAGRGHSSETVRQLSWILAASQLIVVAVSLFLGIFKAIAIAILAIAAIGGLIFLFTDRDRSPT
jgi:hypothetical protein